MRHAKLAVFAFNSVTARVKSVKPGQILYSLYICIAQVQGLPPVILRAPRRATPISLPEGGKVDADEQKHQPPISVNAPPA